MKPAAVFWFTGLSGSGKTTVAEAVKVLLEKENYRVLILDGDDVRKRLHIHMGFTEEDIKENNKRIAYLCKEQQDEHDVILVPIISPFHSCREEARRILGNRVHEIYFSADLETVVKRDVKGFYAKAQRLEITNMIGFSPGTVYEPPLCPDLVLHSGSDPKEKSISELYGFIVNQLSKSAAG